MSELIIKVPDWFLWLIVISYSVDVALKVAMFFLKRAKEKLDKELLEALR